jgi:signal transduction histidine kinase
MAEPTSEPRILVVDDDAGLLHLISKSLRREGFAVRTATSGDQTEGEARGSDFLLMLVDLRLPDTTGPALVARLRARGIEIPFVVITGQGDERVAVEMMRQGALDYLVKDAEFLDTMPTRVRRAVESVQQKRRLIEAEAARKRLEEQILEISGREQRRIGQDLHDGLGQHLTGIELMTLCLEQALKSKSRPEAEQAAKISKHVREAIQQTKALARGLSPVELDRHGLMAALQELASSTCDLCRIDCSFECPQQVHVEDNVLATQLYRIAQEAVNNAVKHGRARKIIIRLMPAPRNTATLLVRDDGAGFDQNLGNAGMGLGIMRYRASVIAASLELCSSPGKGTEVRCTFPYQS